MKTLIYIGRSILLLSFILLDLHLAAQNIQGASTNNRVVKFTNTSFVTPTAGNSLLYDDGTNVGISINTPNYLVHQDGGNGAPSYHQFTNGTTTGTSATDGFLVGIASSGIAEFRQQMNNPIAEHIH